MASDMTSEHEPQGATQDDTGVGDLADSPRPMSPEDLLAFHKANHSSVDIRALELSRPTRFSATLGQELTKPDIETEFRNLRESIQIYKMDLGVDPLQIDEEERAVRPLSNTKKGQRANIIRAAVEERQALAIAAFPKYLAAWREADAENEGIITSFERMFEEAGIEGLEAQVAVVDETRSQLKTILSIKGTYYTEMLTTLLIDSGFSPAQAEEQVLTKAPPVGSAVSIPERTQNLRDLKTAAIDFLLNQGLDTTIEAWEALYPGLGEEAEMRIMSIPQDDVHTRVKLAKELYKKVHTEVERRRNEFRERVYQYFKSKGRSSNQAHFDAREIDYRLGNLTRTQQILAMRSDDPVRQIEASQPQVTVDQFNFELYSSIAAQLLRLGDPEKKALGERFREGLSNPESREETQREIDEYLRNR